MSDTGSFLANISADDARIMWKYSAAPGKFPGRIAGIVRMVQGVGRSARRALARFFASLSPRAAVIAIAALLRRSSTRRPARVLVTMPVPLRMTSQRQHATVAPARGSPTLGGSLTGDRPPD